VEKPPDEEADVVYAGYEICWGNSAKNRWKKEAEQAFDESAEGIFAFPRHKKRRVYNP